MQNSPDKQSETFQQLFYERIRHNKQLSILETNILMADSF